MGQSALPGAGRPVHSFLIEDARGHRMDAARQKNHVVFINFWSLTCVPCKAEMQGINDLGNRYKDDTSFSLLPIDLDHNFDEDLRFFNEKQFALGVYAPAGVVPQELFMGVLPTTAVLDKRGCIVLLRQEEGRYDTPSFFRLIDSLLAQ